jgi:hypothetical protein
MDVKLSAIGIVEVGSYRLEVGEVEVILMNY